MASASDPGTVTMAMSTLSLATQALDIVDAPDHSAAVAGPDHSVRAVEDADEAKPLVDETAIAGECGAEQACPDDHDVPGAVEPKAPVDLLNKPCDFVPDTARAKLAEIREVLADLGGVETDHGRQVARRDAHDALSIQLAQLAQVQGEARHSDRGDVPSLEAEAHCSDRRVRPGRDARITHMVVAECRAAIRQAPRTMHVQTISTGVRFTPST